MPSSSSNIKKNVWPYQKNGLPYSIRAMVNLPGENVAPLCAEVQTVTNRQKSMLVHLPWQWTFSYIVRIILIIGRAEIVSGKE